MPIILPDSDSEDELPPAWEERATADGSVFYVNHITKGTQWTHPRTGKKKVVSGELPFGWVKQVDSEGKVSYFDKENNRTTYTDPRLAFAVEEKTHPHDIRQRFDASTTALQVLHGRDLSNKIAIITGANCGIGYETALTQAKHGCNVIMACRNLNSGLEAIEKIRKEKPDAANRCRVMELDLSSLENVKAFALQCLDELKKVDMLILNAGVFGLPYSTTVDGFETTFQVSHLSHMYLTLLLAPLLKKGSRVVSLSSESHRFANFPKDNLTPDLLSVPMQKYWSMMAYNNAKLCNVLFVRELSKRWWANHGISVFSVHPGNMVSTNIQRNWWLMRILFALVRPFTKSLQQAASTTVYAATALELEGVSGIYLNNCYYCETSKLGQSDTLAKELWDLSIKMIREKMGDQELPDY
ncbi:WW domain-containing oxidoreductase-like [Ctenocephalides felis]|uniref:WW domain-containing oxidoreductase-like n=1 Tax=Ctenocephalides felis TaxID=7515 RepID=UPI000E6E5983|nr:WW domain-containing oxidoreductase-like [Ctenocephalides felis]